MLPEYCPYASGPICRAIKTMMTADRTLARAVPDIRARMLPEAFFHE
jgi:hypothetical protein